MVDLSLHILDVVQNSLAGGATRIAVGITEDFSGDLLTIEVCDNGRGIPQEILPRVLDPFFTSRSTRDVGLGLPLFKAAAERCGGSLELDSAEGRGTRVLARFALDHFDRAPLGDLGETMSVLIACNPEVDFSYHHRVNGATYRMDTREMREVLGGVSLGAPSVLDFVRRDIQSGLKGIGAATFPKIMEVLR